MAYPTREKMIGLVLLTFHTSKDIFGDSLNTFVWSLRCRVNGGSHVSGRRGKAIGPPTTRCVKNNVILRTGINCGRKSSSIELSGRRLRRTCRDHGQTWQIRWIAMKFPADQSRNALASLHAGSCEQPVFRRGTDPICSASARWHVARAHQETLVRTLIWERAHRGKAGDHSLVARTKVIDPSVNPIWCAAGTGARINPTATGIAREEAHTHAGGNRRAQVFIHLDRIVLIVSDRNKPTPSHQPGGIRVSVQVGNIS